MKVKTLAAISAAIVLAGCAPNPPAISEISDSSLKVRAFYQSPIDQVNAQADQGCALYKKKATPISSYCVDQNCVQKEYLYACND